MAAKRVAVLVMAIDRTASICPGALFRDSYPKSVIGVRRAGAIERSSDKWRNEILGAVEREGAVAARLDRIVRQIRQRSWKIGVGC